MGIREQLGGMLEAALNEAVDNYMGDALVDQITDKIKVELQKLLNDDLKMKIKANIIDKIDGEDDIKDV
jgi:hypothetical protein